MLFSFLPPFNFYDYSVMVWAGGAAEAPDPAAAAACSAAEHNETDISTVMRRKNIAKIPGHREARFAGG